MGIRQGLDYIINLKDGTFGKGIQDAESKVHGLDSAVAKIGGTIAAAFAIDRMVDFGKETVELSAKMQGLDNIIKFSNAPQATQNLNFIKDTIKELKLPLIETTEGYSKFLAGVKGSALEGEAANTVFRSLAEATTVLHLPAEQSASIFLALQQMVGKTKIQAQELTLQLGQSLPGAIQAMARSLHVGVPELYQMMEKGQLIAADVLPKFAAELHNTFGGSVANALDSTQSGLNEVNNEMVEQKKIIGQQIKPLYMDWLSLQVAGLNIIGMGTKFYAEHKEGLTALAVGLGVAGTAYGLYYAKQKAGLAISAIQYTWGIMSLAMAEANTLGLTGWTAAQYALNVAMGLNPIGLIVTGVALLAAGLYYAWQKSETFRGVIKGLWAATTELLSPVMALGKAFIGLVTLDFGQMKEGLKDAAIALANMNVKGAFEKAYLAEVTPKGKEALTTSTATAGTGLAGAATGKGKAAGGAGHSAAAGRSVRNVNVTIQNLVRELNVHAKTIKESGGNIRDAFSQILVDATRDFEQAM